MSERIVIVDDEPPARALLCEYLAEEPGTEVVAECRNGREAVEAVREHTPDLLFLDVQMPGLNGFDVLEALADTGATLPQIIFSTAHDDHAVDAFEAGAADYLLKPYSRPRFQKALRRARQALRRGQDSSEKFLSVLRSVREQARPSLPERLFVRQGRRIVPVETSTIGWIEADGDYARLHTPGGTFLHSAGLGALAERLGAEDADEGSGSEGPFLRVHRSSIIALAAVEHLASDGQGGYVATLRIGENAEGPTRKVRVSRSYAPAVRRLVE